MPLHNEDIYLAVPYINKVSLKCHTHTQTHRSYRFVTSYDKHTKVTSKILTVFINR